MQDKIKENITALLGAIDKNPAKSAKVIMGLDGFVDEIIHVVDKRQDFDTFERISTIAEFGERISRAAGLSANIEFVTKQFKLGGNGPIMANALLAYDAELTYVGSIGEPDIHAVFKPMTAKCKSYPLCDPGHTDALEFDDGKIMLGKIEVLNKITWELFAEKLGGAAKIAEMLDSCELFGMENWTMIPHMGEVFEGIIKNVFPLMKRSDKPIAFFDLADPEKRTVEDIAQGLDQIRRFGEKFKVILGLNEKEVYEIADVVGVKYDKTAERGELLRQITTDTHKKLDIYCLVVHPTREACACTAEGYFHTFGPYCEKPLLTTGAGDNFNAGFCMAQTAGYDIQSSLLAGVSTSGFYVRNAKSPSHADLRGFLQGWLEGKM